MQRFALAAIVLAGCLHNPTVEVDQQSLEVARGTAADVLVSIDGVPVTDLDEILWTVDDEQLATVTPSHDGYHLRVGGNLEGETIVHVFAYGQDVAIPTRVGPPETLMVWTEPTTIHTTIGSQVQMRAMALDSTAHIQDVTFASRWAVRDESVVNLDSSGMMLRAMDAGETTLHVLHDGHTTVVPVAVFK